MRCSVSCKRSWPRCACVHSSTHVDASMHVSTTCTHQQYARLQVHVRKCAPMCRMLHAQMPIPTDGLFWGAMPHRLYTCSVASACLRLLSCVHAHMRTRAHTHAHMHAHTTTSKMDVHTPVIGQGSAARRLSVGWHTYHTQT